jgi:hypothetical protein
VFKTPLNAEGFFLEAHMKLRPVDFASEGLYLAGLAHYPKPMDEAITQADGRGGPGHDRAGQERKSGWAAWWPRWTRKMLGLPDLRAHLPLWGAQNQGRRGLYRGGLLLWLRGLRGRMPRQGDPAASLHR